MPNFTVTRNKDRGTANVKIRNDSITKQKADAAARKILPGAKFVKSYTTAHNTVTVRQYAATAPIKEWP
jgi:hypothetical protein